MGETNIANKYCSRQYLSLLEITKCHALFSQTVFSAVQTDLAVKKAIKIKNPSCFTPPDGFSQMVSIAELLSTDIVLSEVC